MRVLNKLRAAARMAAKLSGILVIAVAVLISTDVAVRGLFNTTLMRGGIGELSGYALAIVTVWGSALALLNRAHIRVDAALPLLPRRIAVALDLLALITFAVMSGVLMWAGWTTFSRTFQLNAHSMTPLAVPLSVPQGLWMAGLIFLFATSLIVLFFAVAFFIRGDLDAIVRLAGTRRVAEEIEEAQSILVTHPGPNNA